MNQNQPMQPSTIGKQGKRQWVYPVEVKGRYTTRRNVIAVILGGLFFAAPWIKVPASLGLAAGAPATWAPLIKLNFLSGQFVLFGQTLLIYEIYRFVFLALMLALILFLSAALYGRLWCGYACPQSIFIDRLFRLIEHVIRGPAVHRKRIAKQPMTRAESLRWLATQVVFLMVSAAFAWTLVALFAGTEATLEMKSSIIVVPFAVLTLLDWFDGAHWREQFCIIVCPYARFQGLMQGRNTRSIGYDSPRGEPRGRGRRTDAAETKGDCIDCGLCVRVCPTGIDIRNGSSQLECIGCAKCIDACDSVMHELGHDPGLIRYDTVKRLTQRKTDGNLPARTSLFRLRTVLYASAILIVGGHGTWAFVHHTPLVLRIVPTTRDPFIRTGDTISNLFTLKIGNQSGTEQSYRISIVSDPKHVRFSSPDQVPSVANGSERIVPVLVTFDPAKLGLQPDSRKIVLEVRSLVDGYVAKAKRELIVP